MSEAGAIRPTKKQRELLEYIEAFIGQHGYSPSYREIMNGLSYNSVATVALHVGNLVKRGHLVRRDHSARSLEPTRRTVDAPLAAGKDIAEKSAWLFEHIEQRFKQAETTFEQSVVDEIYVLIGAIKVLGFQEQAVAFIGRLRMLEESSK